MTMLQVLKIIQHLQFTPFLCMATQVQVPGSSPEWWVGNPEGRQGFAEDEGQEWGQQSEGQNFCPHFREGERDQRMAGAAMK